MNIRLLNAVGTPDKVFSFQNAQRPGQVGLSSRRVIKDLQVGSGYGSKSLDFVLHPLMNASYAVGLFHSMFRSSDRRVLPLTVFGIHSINSTYIHNVGRRYDAIARYTSSCKLFSVLSMVHALPVQSELEQS